MSGTEDDVEIEKEVKDFNFRHLCKLRIGPPVEDINSRFSHLAISNKHGLIFAVSSHVISVVSLVTLEDLSVTNISVNDAVSEFAHEIIPVGVDIEKICLNSDETNIIFIYKDGNGLQIGAIDICILNSPDKSNAVYTSMVLHNSADIFAKDIRRHPELPGITAVCLSSGHVFIVELTTSDGFKVIGSLTQGPLASSVCWSPKGKQIVVGLIDGRLIQYDKILKSQKKVINRPDIFNDEPKEVGGLFWISSYLFMAVYNSPDLTEAPIFVLVATQKDGPPSYTIMDDIYFGFNEERLLCYYFSYIPEWQVMITMASNAMEAVPVGTVESKWYRWGLQDTGRAEVPLNALDNNDAFTVGIGICMNSSLSIKQDDKDLPPAPIFAMLTTDGVLCTYQMVNQFPNINHGILTEATPIPNLPPKTGAGNSIQQPPAVSVIKPVLDFGQSSGRTATPAVNPSFFAPNRTITSAENTLSAFKFGGGMNTQSASSSVAKQPIFNFSGSAMTSAGTPIASVGTKFTTPVPSSSNTPIFSLSNPQGSTTGFPFGFSNNLASGPAASNNPISLQTSISPSNKPLFNVTSAAPPFKSTGFSFNSTSVEPVPSPKPVVKPTVSIIDNSVTNKQNEISFKQTEPSKSFFTPVVRPLETASGPTKPIFQPVAQQQAAPVKPQVVPLTSDNVSNFGHMIGTPSLQQPPQQHNQQNINSPALVTPNKSLLQQTISTPQQTPGFIKNEYSPTVDSEIEQHTAKWNTTLQKNICEEINNFNVELNAFKESCVGINCEILIGSRGELVKMKEDIADLVNHMDGYKGVMKENKSECSILRENVLQNLKMLDEATLLKQKMEDKRYSIAMKSRPLDPISTRQRKGLRASINQVEQLLNDINVALDTKWEERIAYRRNARNKTSAIIKRQQIYQTIDAIDQITNNLSGRLKKISLQGQENTLLIMNLSRKSTNDITTTQKSPNKSFVSKSTGNNSPLKLKQLKSYLNNRGQTPVRKAKPYASLILPRDRNQNLNPSFSNFPKAASTPAPFAQDTESPRKVFFPLPHPDSIEKQSLSSTLATIGNKSMTPTVLNKSPSILTNLKVPDNTPTTPQFVTGKSQPSKPSVQFGMCGNDMSGNDNISHEVVNKNLFGTPSSVNTCMKPSNKVNQEYSSVQTPSTTDVNTEESVNNTLSNPFVVSGADPKDFWGNSISSKPISGEIDFNTQQYTNVFPGEIPTGDSPEANLPESFLPSPSTNTTDNNLQNNVPVAGSEIIAFSSAPPTLETSSTEALFSSMTGALSGSAIKSVTDLSERSYNSEDNAASITAAASKSGHSFGFGATCNVFPRGLNTASVVSTTNDPRAPVAIGNVVTTSVLDESEKRTVETSNDSPGEVTKDPQPFCSITSTCAGFTTTSKSASLFGTPNTIPTSERHSGTPLFGAPASSSVGLFGTPTTPSGGLFGNSVFGTTDVTTSTSSALYGSANTTTGLFPVAMTTISASSNFFATPSATAGGIFGTPSSTSAGLFSTISKSSISETSGASQSGNIFRVATTGSVGGIFATASTASTGELSEKTVTSTGVLLGIAQTSDSVPVVVEVTTTSSTSVCLFGTTVTSSAGLFGTAVSASTTMTGSLFGGTVTTTSSGTLFGSTSNTPPTGGLFGTSTVTSKPGGLFGSAATTAAPGGLFATSTSTASIRLFGATTTTAVSGGLFGTTTTTTESGGIFGVATKPASVGLFGADPITPASGGLFATSVADSQSGGFFKTPSSSAGGIFGNPSTTSSFGSVFGNTPASATTNIFGSSTATNTSAFGSTGFGATVQPKEAGGFGGFGLGGGPVNDPNKNPFGAVASSPGNNTTNIFGASSSSTFGQTSTTAALGSGTFSKGFGSGITSGGAFGTSGFGTPASAAAPAFGSVPAFGSPPAFGGTPAFGGAPTFGASPPSSAFGSGAAFGSGSTFGSGGVFGGGGSALPSFGSLANQTETTPTFGSQAPQPAAQTFGFGEVPNNPNPSGQQFSSWR